MKIELPHYQKKEEDFFESMKNCFIEEEWSQIKYDQSEALSKFYLFWTLKESYIKAIGIGLGMDLQSFSFSVPKMDLSSKNEKEKTMEEEIFLFLGKEKKEEWKFCYFLFDKEYIISLCLGPPSQAIRQYHDVLPLFSQNVEQRLPKISVNIIEKF